jgi:hypothetical protein
MLQPGGTHGDKSIVRNFEISSGMPQQLLHGADVAHRRNAPQLYRIAGEQTGRERGQRGIFRSAHRDLAFQRHATVDVEFIHSYWLLVVSYWWSVMG